MPEGGPPLKVAVAGGSIGGLCAAVALRGVGCEVDVYERAPGALAGRGAGIVVQDDLMHLLRWCDGAPELPAISCLRRRYLLPDGGDGLVASIPQRLTSWDAIFRTLRAGFPDERYHAGSTLTGFRQVAGRVVAHFAERGEVEADLLVCADGSRSAARRRLLPGVEPSYAGYVAWRGTLEEERASPGLVRFLDASFTVCAGRSGGHILCYLIPGPGAAIQPGRRRLNWVWYVSTPAGPGLERLLTDRTGERHAASVPAGLVPAALVAEVHVAATRELHRHLAELVRATPDPFVQAIVDVAVPRMAFGRACLIGDAAFVVRPHAAAATAKAAADATALADALSAADPDAPDAALRAWEARRLEHGRGLVEHGVALGRRTVGPPDAGCDRHPPTLREVAERFGVIAQLPKRR